jgi:hypothetical protein
VAVEVAGPVPAVDQALDLAAVPARRVGGNERGDQAVGPQEAGVVLDPGEASLSRVAGRAGRASAGSAWPASLIPSVPEVIWVLASTALLLAVTISLAGGL